MTPIPRPRHSHGLFPPGPAAWLALVLLTPAAALAQDDAAPKAPTTPKDVQKTVEEAAEEAAETAKEIFEFIVPAGLPEIVCPEDNPQSAAKVELGKMLYYTLGDLAGGR